MVMPPTEAELHAYVDGELAASRRQQVAEVLEADPVLAARVAAYVADRDRLRQALAGAALPAPPSLVALIEREVARRPRRMGGPGWRMMLAAGLAAAIATGAGIAYLSGRPTGILASAEAVRDTALTSAAPTAGQRDAQLQARTGLHVRAPNLSRFGFQLVGLHLYGDAGYGSAQLSYLDGTKRLLTIYVRRSDGKVRFDLLHHGKLRLCVWQDDVVGAVIIAPMRAGEMLRIASSAYSALDF